MQASRSAAGIIAGDDDILIEILLYMPTKSLIKFKTVSKHWLSLISSSHFSHLHTIRHRSTTASALCLRKPLSDHYLIPLQQHNSPPRIQTLQFKLTPNWSHNINPIPTAYNTIKIMQSCNGLLLLQVFPNDQNFLKEYYVYNPATHKSRFLQLNSPPRSSSSAGIDCENKSHSESKSRVLGLSLAYDPLKSVHFKVICVRFATFSVYSHEIEVYESESNSWKLANGGKEVVLPYDLILCDGVYWNGNIHWIRPKGESFYFDLDNDCVVQCPGIPIQRRAWSDRGRETYYFGNSNGHLHFVTMSVSPSSEPALQVFEMKNYCSRWFLKFQVNFNDILCEYPEMRRTKINYRCPAVDCYAFCVLGMVRGEKDEESVLVLHVPGKVVAYKFKDGSFVELADFRAPSACFYREGYLQFGLYDACEFIETLAPI